MGIELGKLNASLRAHVAKHVGEVAAVYHEPMMAALTGGGVPMEVLHVAPAKRRPFHTLVTMGMSQEALETPKELSEFAHVELMMRLPTSWEPPQGPVVGEKVDGSTWPLRHLLSLAQACHGQGRFLMFGTFVPNGNEPGKLKPFTKGVPFYGTVVWADGAFGEEFMAMPVSKRATVLFLSLICLKQDETEALLPLDLEELVGRLNGSELPYVADPARKSVLA